MLPMCLHMGMNYSRYVKEYAPKPVILVRWFPPDEIMGWLYMCSCGIFLILEGKSVMCNDAVPMWRFMCLESVYWNNGFDDGI